jgi:hypothetical protein
VQHSRYDDLKSLMPVIRENYDVLSTVTSTSKNRYFPNESRERCLSTTK